MTQREEERIAEDAPFEVPPFDEKEYIRKELISFKTTLILFVFSVVIAGASYALWKSMPDLRFLAHIAIALALGLVLVRFVFKALKVDVSHWRRKEWIGTYFLYFFFWLGFFLLFTNPPFTDAAAPVIEAGATPDVQAAGEPVYLGAYIADNVGVQSDSIRFCIHKLDGAGPAPAYTNLTEAERQACNVTWTKDGDKPNWNYTFTSSEPGRYAWHATAEDKSGHAQEINGVIEIGDPFPRVEPPRANRFEQSTDSLNVLIDSDLNVRVVQFTIDDGNSWHGMRKDPDPERQKDGWWKTDPAYEGWSAGEHQVRVRALEQPLFVGQGFKVGPGTAYEPDGVYNVTVATGGDVGSKAPPEYKEKVFIHPGQTPGFEWAVALVAVGGLVVGRRRRAA